MSVKLCPAPLPESNPPHLWASLSITTAVSRPSSCSVSSCIDAPKYASPWSLQDQLKPVSEQLRSVVPSPLCHALVSCHLFQLPLPLLIHTPYPSLCTETQPIRLPKLSFNECLIHCTLSISDTSIAYLFPVSSSSYHDYFSSIHTLYFCLRQDPKSMQICYSISQLE
jgi:hypothetical protein